MESNDVNIPKVTGKTERLTFVVPVNSSWASWKDSLFLFRVKPQSSKSHIGLPNIYNRACFHIDICAKSCITGLVGVSYLKKGSFK